MVDLSVAEEMRRQCAARMALVVDMVILRAILTTAEARRRRNAKRRKRYGELRARRVLER